MTYTTCEVVRVTVIDEETGLARTEMVQRDRDCTPAEIAEIEARKTAPPPVPAVVSRFQAKAALLHAGLLANVEALMADANTPLLARLAWAEALDFRRDSPTVAAMGAALGLSDGQVDDLFRTGAAITA